jgi:hypothetical protein
MQLSFSVSRCLMSRDSMSKSTDFYDIIPEASTENYKNGEHNRHFAPR